MDRIKTFLQGFVVGLGKIMPGVSGSVMAICFGIYERMISAFSSFKIFKKDIKFIGTLGFGIILAIVVGSNIIKVLLVSHYVPAMMFMVGMMIPGLIPILREVKNEEINWKRVVACILTLLFLVYINVMNTSSHTAGTESYLHEFISLFLCGIIDAASTIIPGISGSALLMMFGYYESIISSLANVFTMSSVLTLIPFLSGVLGGVIITSKMVTYLFKHHRALTYMIIVVFASFSILSIFTSLLNLIPSAISLCYYLIFTVLGFLTTFMLEKLFSR